MVSRFDQIHPLRKYLSEENKKGKTIGFVPTMGALHNGHISLIERSKGENDITVCSIFVNPTQFNNPADLLKYPRPIEHDKQMLEKALCDILFLPEDNEMYPSPGFTKISFGSVEDVMEGKYRKGHFSGVGIILSKLFHIIQPDNAYFGQKDLQQCAVVKVLVKDLFFNVNIITCPTLREADGLAMSSRNKRLSPEQRQAAPVLYQTLEGAKKDLFQGKKIEKIKSEVEHFFKLRNDMNLEYFEIVDNTTLLPIQNPRDHKEIAICIATYFGEVRLIDNIIFQFN